MMKKTITIILLIIGIITMIPQSYALTITPTVISSPTPGVINKTINTLKDKIASRVAQLNLVTKKGILGTVSDISETQITLTDQENNTKIVDVDELTKFSSPNTKSNFGISDITKGMFIGVYGLYNKESQRLLARFVDLVILPQLINGTIASLDTKNYVVHVSTTNNPDIYIDVETITKTYSYTPDTNLTKSGFSKLVEGQRIFVAGYPDKQEKSHIIASRMIHFPLLVTQLSLTPSPTTTDSAKRLTPTVKP